MAATSSIETPTSGISRREFLYYIFGASIALYLGQVAGVTLWYALPRIKEGTFGGLIPVTPDAIPKPNDPPTDNANGRFWLVNLEAQPDQPDEWNQSMYLASDEVAQNRAIVGIAAIYKVCTHLGCIYSWNSATHRFECPCHGSKYRLDGRRIEDPAPRNLDRFPLSAFDADGALIAESVVDEETGQMAPLQLDETQLAQVAEYKIDTGSPVSGASQVLLTDVVSNSP
ncbi:MAG: Rieske 2Fe-2S domain-containing protein [Anaerolineales bacterium]|nr:Rieske 2Fe-2S domain-containing protein [Anaerolineales bacterium]